MKNRFKLIQVLLMLMFLLVGLMIGINIQQVKRGSAVVPPVNPEPSKVDLVAKLAAGVQLSYFKNLIGEPVFRNSLEETDLIEWIFVDPDFYIQAITDPDEKVMAYAVTSRNNNFQPTYDIAEQKVTLRQTTFDQLRKDGVPLDCSWNLGNTAPGWYWEAYNYGNPGDYQDYIYAINNSAQSQGYPQLKELGVDRKTEVGCQDIDENTLPNYPINTIMITDQGMDSDALIKKIPYIGPDSVQMRMLKY